MDHRSHCLRPFLLIVISLSSHDFSFGCSMEAPRFFPACSSDSSIVSETKGSSWTSTPLFGLASDPLEARQISGAGDADFRRGKQLQHIYERCVPLFEEVGWIFISLLTADI